MRIFKNCKLYNQPETLYYKCSCDLEEFIKPHLESLKEGKSEMAFGDNRKSSLGKVNKKKAIEKKTHKKTV